MNQEARDWKMPFGKYKGETLEEIYIIDKEYLAWCMENLENDDLVVRIETVIHDMRNTRIY